MNKFHIWPAAPADADVLVALERQAFGERSWGEISVRASFLAPRVAIVLGATDKKAPRGLAMWRDLGEEAEILSIGVVPAARRKGLGNALLGAVLAAARDVGAMRLLLEVSAANAAALALYKAAGFEKLSVRRAYYRDGADAVVMHAIL